MLPILQVPHPILRQKSKPVAQIDTKVIGFIKQLQHTLVHQHNPKGVGLSAVQVGKLWRIFVTYLPLPRRSASAGGSRHIRIFINPTIVSVSKKLTLGPHKPQATSYKPILEGCLSIPRIYGPVWRHQWIKLKYQSVNTSDGGAPTGDDSSEVKTAKFSGFPARVIQHEMDHLDGILFTDRCLAANLPLYEETGDKLITLA